MKNDVIIRSRAPLRISFGGGGTDVPPYPETYGGVTLSTTIDRYAYVTLKNNSKKGIRVISQDYGLIETLSNISDIKIKGKTSLIKAALLQSGLKKENLDIIIHVDSPPGSGLGSSSAVAIAIVGALSFFLDEHLTKYQIAKKAIILERELLGIKGGYQDQYASCFGGFNFIEFKKTVTVNPIRLHPSVINELLSSSVLVNSKKTRFSGNIINKQISKFNQNDEVFLSHLKKIKNLAYELKEFLLKGNINKFGHLLELHWEEKQKLTESISTPYIEKLYTKLKQSGGTGGKILGAGGGGHIFFICPPEKRNLLFQAIDKTKAENIKFNFEDNGLQTWMVQNGVSLF
jgi:D-glycero-alpha-D-manno-heptose-7-phosphate kinase